MTDFNGIIECLEEIRDEMCSHCDREACEFELCRKTEALNRAILLFNKQIPKKPRFVDDLVYEKYVCECGNVVAVETVEYIRGRSKNYCDRCGQAIDWSSV